MSVRRLWTVLAALLAVGACSPRPGETSPLAYRHPVDVVKAAFGIHAPCQRRVPGADEEEHVGYDACYRLHEPERMRGVWLDQFEGSHFLVGRDAPAATDEEWYGDAAAWLEFHNAPTPPEVTRCRERRERCVFLLDVVGRRTIHPGGYGHMGGSRHLLLVDRVLSVREIADPAGDARAEIEDVKDTIGPQGFSGALYDGGDTLRRLGSWTGRSRTYRAYFYEHVDPSREGGHAVRAIVIMDDQDRYLGRYTVEPSDARMEGPAIVFDVPAADGDRIVIGDDGPPARARLDGQVVELTK